ncbi:hypothetical protein PDIDSM_5207 [Penicillium digitatum]|nr:hypothetical protein PDIDSM_5207 [Penicillium digitatum]
MVEVITGPLFDTGNLPSLIIFVAFLLPFGWMITSLATNYQQLTLVCIGLVAGFLFVPFVAILSQYSRCKRGLTNGLVASGSRICGVIYPILFDQLQKVSVA